MPPDNFTQLHNRLDSMETKLEAVYRAAPLFGIIGNDLKELKAVISDLTCMLDKACARIKALEMEMERRVPENHQITQ